MKQEATSLLRELARRVNRAERLLAFTGAGISTGSGIPDFRGPQGLWRTWQPVYYDQFLASHEARVRHWEFKAAGWRAFREASPNPAHRALVELERRGRLQWLVTQNIDGLHLKAGHDPARVLELHGTNLQVECVECLRRFPPEPFYEEFERTHEPPGCPDCGGWCKPATVSFGQQMPMDLMDRALTAARQADVILAIGSTLEVYPAASVPLAGKKQGAWYAILNQGETGHDGDADLRLEGDAVDLLPEMVRLMDPGSMTARSGA